MKEFRYHPEIEGLKINEDGSEIFLNEQRVEIVERPDKFKHIYYKNKIVSISRLILECWVGMPPEPKLIAKHKDLDQSNFHYTNLEWRTRGGNPQFPTKLTKEQELEIIEKYKSGVSLNKLHQEYSIAVTTVKKVIKRYENR